MMSSMNKYEYLKEFLEDSVRNGKTTYVLSKSKSGLYIPVSDIEEKHDCCIYKELKYDDKFNKILFEFNGIINDLFPDYTNSFNKNIKSLKINDYKFNLFKYLLNWNSANAYYDCYDNEITFLNKIKEEKDVRRILMHELLHLSSSKGLVFCGLSNEVLSMRGPITLGNALNEGYTEYLNKKYFSKEESKSYRNQIVMAQMIEKIVGPKTMIDAYFNCDLLRIINKLRYYSKDLLLPVDTLIDMDSFKESKYKDIRRNLALIYNRKLDRLLENNRIRKEDYERRKFLYVDRFIEDNVVYDKDAIVEKEYKSIVITDSNNKKVIKGDFDLNFMPDNMATDGSKLKIKK